MAGFAVILGSEGTEEAAKMLKRMSHRGPFKEGVSENGSVVMAQNYLRGDNPD